MLRFNAVTRLIQLIALLQIAGVLALVALALRAALPHPAAAASISGVCPDGSIFIVQRAEAIPCRDSKVVEPHDVPPLKPEMLPRPYGWEALQRRQDPNNPYNAVDAAPSLRRPGAREARTPRAPRRAPVPPPAPSEASGELAPRSAPVAVAARPPAPRAAAEAAPRFSEQERRDLRTIIELAQGRVPATFEPDRVGPTGAVTLRLARSRAFEPRLRAQWDGRGGLPPGPVLLFAADAAGAGAFHGKLTFVQDQVTFTPDAGRPSEIGVIDGALGSLAPGQSILGYARLPEQIDVTRPLDVYWNDRLLTATFASP